MEQYLQPTTFFDYHHPSVSEYFSTLSLPSEASDIEKAVAIYYAVRDDFRYETSSAFDGVPTFAASFCFKQMQGYCLPKASLMIALCRKAGLPARIGLADVKNHLANPQIIEMLRSEIFSMHGYVEIFLSGKWVKATPAFDDALCQRNNIKPLAFNGIDDSIFHEFTPGGDKHMEYLVDHGHFEDMPVTFIHQNFAKHYPHLLEQFSAISQ